MEQPLPHRPYSIAHRGASAYAPENTLAAFRKAAALGADMWEVDIRVTSDGAVVVFHDAALADGRLVVDLTVAEVLVAKPDIPRLEEVLALAAELGAGIYADIKDLNACLPTLDGLKSHGIELAIIGAFHTDVVDILRRASCPYPISALVPIGADPHEYAPHADVIHLCWEHMDRPQEALTPALFQRAFANGQRVALWHEEDPTRMAAIRAKPVTGICSDRPEMVNPFQAPSTWPVGVVCHRGANKIAPENTLPALECALAAGFSHIEIDLHITADGEIVVMHDPTLERTTNGTGPITRKTLTELRALDAGGWFDPFFAGTQLPTLDEVLDLVERNDGQIYLELKSAPGAPVWSRVVAAGLQKRCFFWSFNRDLLIELRTLTDEATIMARRQDYPSLQDAIQDYSATVIEFLPHDDPLEIAALRDSPITSMVAYGGQKPDIFDRLVELRPDLVNLDQPFAFGRYIAGQNSA
jgi:glycerophosphoryl diester phosphodiesterase